VARREGHGLVLGYKEASTIVVLFKSLPPASTKTTSSRTLSMMRPYLGINMSNPQPHEEHEWFLALG
jgi:hypothetical protein